MLYDNFELLFLKQYFALPSLLVLRSSYGGINHCGTRVFMDMLLRLQIKVVA
jgi:hypothetical protein